MHMIHAHNPHEIEFCNQDGRKFLVRRGVITGALLIVKGLDQERGVGPDKGYLELVSPVCISNGDSYSYKCIFHPGALWPTPDIKVKRLPGHFKCHVTLQTVLDTRDLPEPVLESGERIKTTTRTGKYNSVTYQLREDGDAVLPVRLTAMNEAGDFEHLYYEIPLERMLWRRWARLDPDDVMPEAEEYVFFKRVGHITDRGHPPGITISPIDLLS